MKRWIWSSILAGVLCLLVGFVASAQAKSNHLASTQDAFLFTSLADLKERVQELRYEIALDLVDPNLTRLQKAQLRGAFRKARSLLRMIARAEKIEAQGRSIEILLELIQSQLDALEEILAQIHTLLNQISFTHVRERQGSSPLSILGSLMIYDLHGRLVRYVPMRSLGMLPSDVWHGLPSGVYFYRYESQKQIHKVIVMN